MTLVPDLFHCEPLNTDLSRNACGARHERRMGACGGCAVGRQHARGALPSTWPDGSKLATVAVTVATMASLRVHLAIIAAHEPAPLRGIRALGATLREHAERLGVHPQVLRSRLNRGQEPTKAITPGLRGAGPHGVVQIKLGRETLTLRGLARKLGVHHRNVQRWYERGMTAEQIVERCA